MPCTLITKTWKSKRYYAESYSYKLKSRTISKSSTRVPSKLFTITATTFKKGGVTKNQLYYKQYSNNYVQKYTLFLYHKRSRI